MAESQGERAGEYRIGPFVFAPGWGSSSEDRWSHRRGEPRLFGLFWVMFVIASVSATLLAVRGAGGPTVERYEFAVLGLLEALVAGVCVLWPMVRLSQARPAGSVKACAADVAVMSIPILAVLLPVPLFTQWPITVIAATGTVLGAWMIGVSGVLAWALRSSSPGDRLAAMLVLGLAVCAAPLVGLALPAEAGTAWPDAVAAQVWVWCSPFTAMWALTRSPGNLVPVVDVGGWIIACWPAIPGAALLFGAMLIRPRDRA
ncbi:MAG: hypothetical protein AAGI30_08675 [Planctomycetota bacterium]